MGVVKLDYNAAFRSIDFQVESGIDNVTAEIARLARSMAPVRKAGPHPGKKASSMRRSQDEIELTTRKVNHVMGTRLIASKVPQTKAQHAILAAHLKGQQPSASSKTSFEFYHDTLLLPANARGSVQPFTIRISPKKGQKALSTAAVGEIRRGQGLGIKFNEETGKTTLTYGGFLKRHIHPVRARKTGNSWVGSVRSEAPYSIYVEFPTRRTRAQPFLLPAFHSAEKRLGSLMKRGK